MTTSCVFGTPLHPAPHPEEGRVSRRSGGAHGGGTHDDGDCGMPARAPDSPPRSCPASHAPPRSAPHLGLPAAGGPRTESGVKGKRASTPPPRPQGARSRVGGNKGPPPPPQPPPRSPLARAAPRPGKEGEGERATRERRGRREEGGACVLLRRPAPGAPRRARLSSRGCSSCRFLTASAAAAAHSERPVARTDGRAGGRTGGRAAPAAPV